MKRNYDDPEYKMINKEKICEGCGTIFSQRENETNHKFKIRRFCKAGCNAKSMSRPIENKNCKLCNKLLSRRDDESMSHYRSRIFCNNSCSQKYKYINRTHKRCNICGLNKSINDFAKRRKDRLARWYICKECNKYKRSANIQTCIKDRLRCRTRSAIKTKHGIKSKKTLELLGCELEFFMKYIENLFIDGMNWENYGEWHIDHIKPCCLFDLTDSQEQVKCFHYTNLQPLWAKDNLKKHIKYEERL